MVNHRNSFSNQLYDLVDAKIKNISTLTLQMVLLKIEIKNFYTINEILNKHYKIKKT